MPSGTQLTQLLKGCGDPQLPASDLQHLRIAHIWQFSRSLHIIGSTFKTLPVEA